MRGRYRRLPRPKRQGSRRGRGSRSRTHAGIVSQIGEFRLSVQPQFAELIFVDAVEELEGLLLLESGIVVVRGHVAVLPSW